MLCGDAACDTIEQLQHCISSELEPFMSILFTDITSIPPGQAADPAMPLPQSSSGTRHPRGWWSWIDRSLQRIALREIADDPHLLRDVGLTREQALREAAKPFWR
jgi:uncharacterized protein YjiS (DUF1127 family)